MDRSPSYLRRACSCNACRHRGQVFRCPTCNRPKTSRARTCRQCYRIFRLPNFRRQVRRLVIAFSDTAA